jgi:hypothetical protein
LGLTECCPGHCGREKAPRWVSTEDWSSRAEAVTKVYDGTNQANDAVTDADAARQPCSYLP